MTDVAPSHLEARGSFAGAAGWRLVPVIALASAILLLLTGAGIGVYNERAYEAQKVRETEVQARILAASVSAALAFNDRATAREYVGALRANPEVEAAGVYDPRGTLVASYGRPGASPPLQIRLQPPSFDHQRLAVTAPVVEGGADLGMVYVSTVLEPGSRRLARYGGLALLMVMGLLVVAVLGAAHGLMTRANRELQTRAEELAEANRQLRVQIAEREKAEEALRQSQRLEALGRLTGGVAHDFNNILMVASSGLDLLDRNTDPTRRDRIRDGIRHAVERGASLTRQLLTFSRRNTLKPQVIDLRAQVEGMRLLLERSLRENIDVQTDLPAGLWPVEVDPSQLEIALLNLAVNARDAMVSGGRLCVSAENVSDFNDGELSGDYVRLSVSDTGPGIPPEVIDHVFEPFFTTKEVGKGTGLGLSQVYGFAKGSGGGARVESRPGEGATMSLYLPRSQKALAETPAPSDPRAVRGGSGRLLLVEDDPNVAVMVREMVADLGYEATHVAGPGAALEFLDRNPQVDLVFSDMVMPGGMDGIELAREIGRRRPDLPVLLTSGFSPATAAAESEGRRVLPKPYTIESLAQAIEAELRNRPAA